MTDILEKIKKIEAMITGAQTQGEKSAALSAKARILKKYPNLDIDKDVLEFSLRTPDHWHKKLLLAICHKYGLKPYRYKGQKYTTVMVRANEAFLNMVVWKEYLEYSDHLEKLVGAITDNLIGKIHKVVDEDFVSRRLRE